MAEQRERFRVAWVDTDTGGRIHFTAAFRWAEVTETSLYRRLGLLRGEQADFPRRHVEAEYFRVLVFDDEVEVRLWVDQVGTEDTPYGERDANWMVSIDGNWVGTTPQREIKLRPGRHKIKLVNPELSLVRMFAVQIKAGETVTESVLLQQ